MHRLVDWVQDNLFIDSGGWLSRVAIDWWVWWCDVFVVLLLKCGCNRRRFEFAFEFADGFVGAMGLFWKSGFVDLSLLLFIYLFIIIIIIIIIMIEKSRLFNFVLYFIFTSIGFFNFFFKLGFSVYFENLHWSTRKIGEKRREKHGWREKQRKTGEKEEKKEEKERRN